MPIGKKYGGRKKGTPNKERREMYQILANKYPNYNPVIAMAEMAHDKKLNDDLRFQCHKEVAKYTFPQLKAVELSAADGISPLFIIELTEK